MISGLHACVVVPSGTGTDVRILRCGGCGPDGRVWQVTDADSERETTSVTDMISDTHNGRCSRSTVHQYCMCSVRMWGSGTEVFCAAGSYLRCSGRSKYHFESSFSKRCSS